MKNISILTCTIDTLLLIITSINFLGVDLIWSAIITRVAPEDNERKISIILGSNVILVDCKMTSSTVTENRDLCDQIMSIQLQCSEIFKACTAYYK